MLLMFIDLFLPIKIGCFLYHRREKKTIELQSLSYDILIDDFSQYKNKCQLFDVDKIP